MNLREIFSKLLERVKPMYIWKYWRETRLVFCVTLFTMALVFGQFLRVNLGNHPHASLADVIDLSPLPYVQAAPIGFLSWLMGSFGVGCNLGERGGSYYLFSRPRGRGYFVWRDWGFGIAQLLLVITLWNLVFGFEIHHWMVSAGESSHGSLVPLGRPATLSTFVCLNSAAEFLFAGLVFGLTYLSTIVVKSSRGVILVAGVLLEYVALNIFVGPLWPSIRLPSLLIAVVPQFVGSLLPSTRYADISFAVSAATRFVVLLLFPIAAQILLQKRDIE